MPSLRYLLPALLLGFTATATFADPPPPPPTDQQGRPGGSMSFLAPEERLMLLSDLREKAAKLPEAQRRDEMRAERARIRAMSDAEKKAFAAKLRARWNALPQAKQAEIKAAVEEMHKMHAPRP